MVFLSFLMYNNKISVYEFNERYHNIMRILVFFDTHGNIDYCIRVVERIGAVDMIIHAGDVSRDAEDLQSIFRDIPVKYVCGNCEVSNVSSELLFEVCGKKIYVTHGHLHCVKLEDNYRTLYNHAKKLGADAAIFGHTHKPVCDNRSDVLLLNPGSCRHSVSYGVIEIEDSKLRAAILDS